MASPEIPEPDSRKRQRLAPTDQVTALQPWRRATELTRCFLYWISVRAFPVPSIQRTWLLTFLDRLAQHLQEKAELRHELFVHVRELSPPLLEKFVGKALDWMPIAGLSRAPNAPMPPLPSEEEIQALREGKKKFDAKEYMPDFCYWFLDDSFQSQMETLFGGAATTMLFLKPDANAKVPDSLLPKELLQNPLFAGADPKSKLPLPTFLRENPLLKQLNVQSKINAAFKLQDAFLAKSKSIFGRGLENRPEYPGYRFIMPTLESKHFFQEPEADVKKWFDLFDVYVHESAADHGILLASKDDLDDSIVGIVEKMKDEGLQYPNG